MKPRRRDRFVGVVLLALAVVLVAFAVLHLALAVSATRQGHTWVLDLVLAAALAVAGVLAIRQSMRLRRRR